MSYAHDASGVMHVQAYVAFRGEFWLARVQPDADMHCHTFWPELASKSTLGGDRSLESIGRTRKSHEEAVPLRIDLVPVPLVERCTQEEAALAQDLWVALAQSLEQGGGPLNVAEEQGDSSHREVVHTEPPFPRSRYRISGVIRSIPQCELLLMRIVRREQVGLLRNYETP